MSNLKGLGQPLGNDRLLSIADVSEIMGFCPITASRFMKETGYAVTIRRRVFILESNLVKYIQSRGVA